MKKFRLLAMLLAILMLPVGLLVACNNDETPPDDGIENPGDGETPGDGTTPGDGNDDDNEKDEVVYDKDGTSSGYLMFFNFDAAQRGNLKHDTKPYSLYFEVTEGTGLSYIITDMMAKSKNSLLIQRLDSMVKAKLDIKLDNVSKIAAEHTLEFDVKVGDGYITDDINIYGSKLTSDGKTVTNTFIKLTAKGVCDATGKLLYEYKEEDSWINVAIGLDDSQRTYNVYVNGAKYSSDIAYSSVSYGNWATSKTKTYTFESGNAKKDFYLHIDNLAIRAGQDPTIRDTENDNIIYTDIINDELHFYKFTDKDTYFNKIEKSYASRFKKEPYGTGHMLYNTFAIYRVNNDADDRYSAITYDYGVELGLYGYGADFGNKKFVLDENNYFFFKANAELEFVGKLNGEDIVGTYTLGTEGVPMATLNYVDAAGSERTAFVKYDDATGNIVYDISLGFDVSPVTYNADTEEYSKFNGKIYGYTVSDMRVTLVVYEAVGLADLFIENTEAVVADIKNAAYTYDNGVITVTEEETSYSFTYTEDEADGTFTYEEKAFGLYDKWQIMDCETLCTYNGQYASFGSFSHKEANFSEVYVAEDWMGKVKIRYFVPKTGLGYSIGLYIANIDHPNETGKASYWMMQEKGEVAGWKELTLDLANSQGTREANIYDITGEFSIIVDGWKGTIGVNADGRPGVKADGYGIIIAEVKFYGANSVNVKGPSADKADCTHENEEGETYFVDNGIVESTCTTIGYTELMCSECGATKVDRTKPIIRYSGHIYDETVAPITVYPTCSEGGYTYKNCVVCGEMEKISDLSPNGHDNYSYYDAAEKMMRVCCKVCGNVGDYAFIDKLMTMQEKVESTLFTQYEHKYQFGVWEGNNENKKFSNSNVNGFQFANKGNIAQTGSFEDGTYYLEFMRNSEYKNSNGAVEKDAFVQFNPEDKFGIASDFVFELDMMLGKKAENGKYVQLSVTAKDRHYYGLGTDYGKDITLFTTNDKGEVIIYENGKAGDLTIPLSEDKFVSLAIAVSPSRNTISVYVDGYLVRENMAARPDDISMFTLCNLRVGCQTSNFDNEIKTKASLYFNNFLCYPADRPICVLQDSSNIVQEHRGDVYLEIADKTPVGPALSVTDAPVELKMPQYTTTTKYVVDFKLTAAELVDGTILTGIKNDEYRFENRQDIITVKGDYIYYLDTAICSVSDAANGVRISLETNDKTGKTVVYINGEAIKGGAIEYGDKYGFYGLSTSYITGFIFDSTAGAYEIADLKMYTGAFGSDTEATPAE